MMAPATPAVATTIPRPFRMFILFIYLPPLLLYQNLVYYLEMTKNERLQKLENAAKEYLNREKKVLNAQYDFLDKILNARGYSKVEDQNSGAAANLLINSIKDFLEGK